MKIFSGQTFTAPLLIDGESDILITDCTFTDRGAVMARNYANLNVEYCTFAEITGAGIVLRSTGAGSVWARIRHNKFVNITESGILAKVGNYHVLVSVNDFINCGADSLSHPIYAMSPDISIFSNVIDATAGNGISIRTSGWVCGNKVTRAGGSAIKYFSDGYPGPSNLLEIVDNTCNGSGESAICLRAGGGPLVGRFVVKDNHVTAYGGEAEFEAGVEFRGRVEYER